MLHTDEQEILLQEWIEEGNEKRSIKEYRKMATERLQTGSSTRSVQLEVHTQRGTATGDDVNAEKIEVLHTDEQEILLQEWIEERTEKRSIKEYRKMATEHLHTGSSTRSVQL